MKTYEVEVERINEEIEIIAETNDLEEAIEIAKKTPRENYKAIGINVIDPDGRLIKKIELEVR